jgi:hypothetical protein
MPTAWEMTMRQSDPPAAQLENFMPAELSDNVIGIIVSSHTLNRRNRS